MNKVEPIRDRDTVLAICDYLYAKKPRDYMLFMFGINTGLRVSDILKLKVSDVRGRNIISLREQKTGKLKEIPVNKDLKKAIREYCENKKDIEWLFPSRTGRGAYHIKRNCAYEILKTAAQTFGLSHIGTHTMRKTFGYHFYYQSGKDVTLLMDIFNHSDPMVTMRYIGVSTTTAFNAMKNFSFNK